MSEDEDDEEEEDESELELLPLRRDGWVWVSTALGFSTAEASTRTDKRHATGELPLPFLGILNHHNRNG